MVRPRGDLAEVHSVHAGVPARVQGSAIVLDKGVELPEGSRVTVIAGEADAPFELTAAEEAELAESIAEADRQRRPRP